MDARERRELSLAGILLAGLVTLAMGVALGDFTTPEPSSAPPAVSATRASALASALTGCSATDRLGGDGSTLTLDGLGAEAIGRLGCILQVTKAPARVMEHITSTTAQDGEQVEEWDDLEAHWVRQSDGGLSFSLMQYR